MNHSRTVELVTQSGDFVIRAQVLPFPTPPDVLLWGTRLFIPRAGSSWDGKLPPVYVEAFTAAVVRAEVIT